MAPSSFRTSAWCATGVRDSITCSGSRTATSSSIAAGSCPGGRSRPAAGAWSHSARPPAGRSQDVPGPFGAASDLPSCRLIDSVLITGGDAISAEVARGVVALEHSAIAAGGDALTLLPGAWRGAASRPTCGSTAVRSSPGGAWWRSAMAGGGARSRPSLARLHPGHGLPGRLEPDSLAKGSCSASSPTPWPAGCSSGRRSTTPTRSDASSPAPTPRPPPTSGPTSASNGSTSGAPSYPRRLRPEPGDRTPGVRTLERLRPGDLVPGDLVLDPGFHPGRKALDVGATPAGSASRRSGPRVDADPGRAGDGPRPDLVPGMPGRGRLSFRAGSRIMNSARPIRPRKGKGPGGVSRGQAMSIRWTFSLTMGLLAVGETAPAQSRQPSRGVGAVQSRYSPPRRWLRSSPDILIPGGP